MKLLPVLRLMCVSAIVAAFIGGCDRAKAPGTPERSQIAELHIYNWSDYIDPSIVKDFEAETKIKVSYDTYDSNEILEAKLLAGKSGYDLVFPSAEFLAREIAAGVIQKVDKTKLKNINNIREDLLKKIADFDPDNEYSVPYMWGTVGFGYNVSKIEAIDPNFPKTSYKMVFDISNVSRMKKCGVSFLDSASDIYPAALKYSGLDPNTTNLADFDVAQSTLNKVRPAISRFNSSDYLDALAAGDICLAFGFSTDINTAKRRAKEAKNGVLIQYVTPDEGAQLWFDQMAIPADASNVDSAHQFIDFMLRPEIIARATNFVLTANANKYADPFVDPEILNDSGVYPAQSVIANAFVPQPMSADTQKYVTRLFTNLKAGR